MRWKINILYDGRPFQGWQSQPHKNTIQDHLQEALGKITKQKICVHGAGRTDAGVHANGQIAHFNVAETFSLNKEDWKNALNFRLPSSIRIQDCQKANEDFHARFSSREKTYSYHICNLSILPPLQKGLVWHLPQFEKRNAKNLKSLLRVFIGKHDFALFSVRRGNEDKETDYYRRMRKIHFQNTEYGIKIQLSCEGFLYKMARMIVGTSVKYSDLNKGKDKFALEWQNKTLKIFCAPPNGLFLEKVAYK